MREWSTRMTRGLAGLVAVCLLTACPDETTSCEYNSDCAADQQCDEGVCTPRQTVACTLDIDCGNGFTCALGICQPRPRGDGGFLGFDGGGGSSGQTGDGVLFLDPSDTVDFGAPIPNMRIERTILIRNDGTGPLTLTQIRLSALTTTEFDVSVTSPMPWVLAANQEGHINLGYQLADTEADDGTLILVSDARACTFNCPDPSTVYVPLTSGFKGVRNLDVSPTLHDFGFVQVGMESPVANINAANIGTQTAALTVESVTLAGNDAAQFQLDLAVGVIPAFIFPGESVDIPVKYKPTALGNHTATLQVSADSEDPSRRLLVATLTGHSEPTLEVVVDPINFGTVQVGQERTQATTIHNNSNVSVTVTNGSLANGTGALGFYFPTPWPFPMATIAPSSTATLDMIFRPTGTVQTQQQRADTLMLNFTYGTGQAGSAQGALSGVVDPPPPPPGGPNLSMAMTFSRNTPGQNGCPSNAVYNSQNMDLILEAGSGGICDKGTGADASHPCSFGAQGTGRWQASGGVAPEPYTTEVITHDQNGGDGQFYVKNRYFDDCADMWLQGSAAFAQAICASEYRYQCFPRSKYPVYYVACGQSGPPYYGYCISETQCLYGAQAVDGRCGSHLGSTAKTVVTIKSASGFTVQQKAFCQTFGSANPSDNRMVVTLIREQGFFRLGTTAAGVTELSSPTQDCP